jgi:hypothetical protein
MAIARSEPLLGPELGGVIVVFTGDFNQLPPAGGTTLDSPLRLMNYELRYSQRVRSGLKILWDNDNVKLYELSEQVRCRDEWWASIWADMRRGTLSRTDIDQLYEGQGHGRPGIFHGIEARERQGEGAVQASRVPRAGRRVACDNPYCRVCTVQVASRRTSRRSAVYT